MKRIGEEVHLDTDEARAGETNHYVRYVLAISLALAVIAMSAVWIVKAKSLMPAHGWPVSAEEHSLGG